ncbi:sensor histidine kinase [Polaribacter vadi]|uniref:sensor histidine kinase n=1 Tax=Polaribacter TaxID=52959 RepID=UPI001C07F29F|nr:MULTISPECIES: sensor histidine kinase [Polaribacter]MBU3010850.1 sensor histidine kinase [Polaribacter vadi]MDO6740662.1 sensor histidine kinase [Polaribacter sp. 1_MG-2023]
MKFLKTFPIILFFLTSAYSQNKQIDSIAKSISNKAWNSYEIQSDSTLYFANKGIEYSKKNNSTLGRVLNLEIKGIYFEEIKNDFKTASELYFKAIEIAEKNHPKLVSSLYNNLCIMFMSTDYEKAVFYGKKAVANSKIIKGQRDEAKAYVNLGIAQSLLKKYDEAFETLNYFLGLKILNQYEKNLANLRIAKNYGEQGLFDKAQPLFLKIVELDSLKGQREYVLDYVQLIENSIKLKDLEIIKKYTPLLIKCNATEKNLEVKKGFYETMTNISIFLNQPKKALEHQTQLLKIKDSINTNFYNKGVVELETKYQTKKKEEKIAEEQSKRKLWSYISILAFVILSIVVILLYKNSQKRKQLNTNKIELEKLLSQRNMLLKETHHRVKNSFQMVSSLLQLQAQGSKAEAAVTALDNAVQRVNSMIVLHQQLYAKDKLLGVDLKVYITDLVNEILGSYSSENIKINNKVDSTILDIDTATSIGLLVNELATNSIKYAWDSASKEKNITLNIYQKNDTFHFTMFDNGTSKKTNNTKQNYGSELIEILIERLEAEKQTQSENDFGVNITFKKQNG